MDAVLPTFPYIHQHTIGQRLKRCFALPWIADYRDPLVGNRELLCHRLDAAHGPVVPDTVSPGRAFGDGILPDALAHSQLQPHHDRRRWGMATRPGARRR